ncbi:hypothetical protein B4U80_07667 [Leptotrombidium deliense]|uniref:Uncharacterized protein n=1 Tax=Leptotrombidium deliense TaxID=299467 RepID=A0A443SL69_9ACAR|nr:hypothetical protein B4U80_07667 [Leptotrombidium deliense]
MQRFESFDLLKRRRLIAYLETLPFGTEDLEKRLNRDLPLLYSPADLMILIEGNNVKVGKKRRWKRAKVINAIRTKFHPECRIIGIDAHYGIIGKSTALSQLSVNFSNAVDHSVSSLFGISCSLFPSFSGVHIEVFHRLTELEVIKDTKGVVLFSSGVSFKGEFLEHPNIQELLYALDGRIALAGAQVNDRLETTIGQTRYSDDTANYYFLNGPPPYNPMFNPQKMSLIGIKFSGPNVRCYSMAVESDCENGVINPSAELSDIERQVKEFKNNLDFDADRANTCETVAFLFFNRKRYQSYVEFTNDVNCGVDVFYSSFPKTKIIGIFSHAQYEYNYWPNICDERFKHLPKDENLRQTFLFPSTRSIASFIIVCIEKESF